MMQSSRRKHGSKIAPLALLPPISFLLLSLAILSAATSATETSRSIQILNQSGRRVSISWIHPNTQEKTIQHPDSPDGILNGASLYLSSYVSHTFEVLELPHRVTKKCLDDHNTDDDNNDDVNNKNHSQCRKDYFTVNSKQNQIIFIQEGVHVQHTDSYTIASERASELLGKCNEVARMKMMSLIHDDNDHSEMVVKEEMGEEEENDQTRKKKVEEKEEVAVEKVDTEKDEEKEEEVQGFFSRLWYGTKKTSSKSSNDGDVKTTKNIIIQNNNDDDDHNSNKNNGQDAINNSNYDKYSEIIEQLAACVEVGISSEIERANEVIAFQRLIREEMAEQWEDYTCDDDTLITSESKRTEFWRGKHVAIMIDRPASKIHVIDDFITEDECRAVEVAAAPILHDATVADGSGGSELSDNRKAKQAGISVNWDKEEDGDLIARLSRRVYDYVNHVLPFNINEDGQEDLMSIQYFGRGPEEDKPDRYMPHCDGDCNGMLFKPGNRMATIVMYCEIPKVGGATNFRNSGVHIQPKRYAATFFSYIDPNTMKMDSGFTEHSGCPVVEGEKKIVTQWVRLGVDDENPWDSFNTLGIKYSDAEAQ